MLQPESMEKDFMEQVVSQAMALGWMVTNCQARKYSPGFPDLCMVRGDRLIFAELKRNKDYG